MNPRRLGLIAGALFAAVVVLVGIVRYGRGSLGPRDDAFAQAGSATAAAGASRTIKLLKNPAQLQPLTLVDLDGRKLALADLHGKVVLVNFWATWCPPCREEIPDLVALQEKYKDRLQIIGISEDSGSPEMVRAFAAAHRINYPIVMETDEIVRTFPSVHALPTTFLLDREGRLNQKHVGMLNAAVTDLETRALAGLEVNASIERVDDDDKVRLQNAAQANKIPGIDLGPLSPERKAMALQKLNTSPCTCGCGLTVAQCRVDDPECAVSLPLAKGIVAEIAR